MQSALTAPRVNTVGSVVVMPSRAQVLRDSEWVVVAFLIYAAGVASALPVASNVKSLVVALNLGILLVYAMLARFDRGKSTVALGVVRDWMPLAVILLAYREMGWFALPHRSHALESYWVSWDRLILRGGAKAGIEAFGPVLPSVLEIAYALVYTLAPFSLAVLYLYRRRERVDRFLFIFAVGVLLCYGQFPFWPSEPPRVVFLGQDLPASLTIFRRFNLWMLGNYGIHTSVFPSAHVGAAFAAAFGMWRALPEHKWVGRFLFGMASLIAVATVYGRYHYAADAAAGIVMAVVALAVSLLLLKRRRGRRGDGLRGRGNRTSDVDHLIVRMGGDVCLKR